jgi:Holliday junction resolvase RusA-like endonuclease
MGNKVASFVVDRPPTGKGRPRFTRTGHAYTPKKTKEMEEYIEWCYIRQCGDIVFDDMVHIEIVAYMPIPKQTTKGVLAWLKDAILVYAPKKPDIDNITKMVLDALNGVAYPDDRSIVSMSVSKLYDADYPSGRVLVTINNVKNIGKDGEEVWKKM